jgi:SAM-dependent methyltransferase
MRLLAALSCAIATASAPCALELRIDSTDVASLFDATANATAVADDLAARAGDSLAQGAGCDDLACVRDRLRAAAISARDRCAASQNTATSRCRKLDSGAICYVGLSAALRRRLASKLVGLVAPISTIDGSNVVVHVPQPALAVVFDESTTSASLKDAVQTFARSYDLDIDEAGAVEAEAADAIIATHVSWQLGSLESLLPAPRTLDPLWRLQPHTYIGVSNQTFAKVAEFWLRRDEFFLRELATRFGASKLTLVDVGAGTGTLSAIVAAVLDSPELRLVDIDNTETNKGLGSDAAALFSRSFDAFSATHPVQTFDGRTLDFDDDQYDVALLTYVLHHAAGDAISLLKEAKRVARNYVIVLEDVIDSEDDAKNAFAHDPRGTFRHRKEWDALFGLLGFEVVAHGPCNSNGLAAFRHTMEFWILAV